MVAQITRLTGILIVSAVFASADVIYNVSLSTAPLIGHPAGPFALDFQFNDGSASGDANNTALIRNFSFGTGSPVGAPTFVGGATGNLGSSITLTDSLFVNHFIQGFNPGATISFQMVLSTNLDSGIFQDQLGFAILDRSGSGLPTLGPANVFLILNLDPGMPTVSTFRSAAFLSPNAGGPPIDIAAPQVSIVPESNSLLLITLALGGIGIATRRKHRGNRKESSPMR